MNILNFINGVGFATILSALVTISTCVITHFQSIRKMKIEKFQEIYDCLQIFSKNNAEYTQRISDMGSMIAEKLPESADVADICAYRDAYREFHKMLREYGQYLDSLRTFYDYLYKDKSNILIVKEECWKILSLYGDFTKCAGGANNGFKLDYLHIVPLLQFLKDNTGLKGRMNIFKYLKKYEIFPNHRTAFVEAFFR